MPADALSWSEERLAAAVRHEAGHIARYDHLVRWISQLACAMYWPNPLVWIAARGLRTEQEKAADDVVLSAGIDADEYVGQLFDVARGIPSSTAAVTRCAVAMATPSTLEARMLAIVDEARDRRPLGRRAVTAGILIVALTLAVSTGGRLMGEENGTPGVDLKDPQLVEVESRFIEFKSPVADSEEALKFLIPEAGKPAVSLIPDARLQATVRALSQRGGTDLLSAPRISMRSGQNASVEIVREFRYAIEWDREGEVWTPKAYATKSVGTTLQIQAKILPDGVIELKAEPSIVTFEGFKDLDSPEGKVYPPSRPGEADAFPRGHRLQAVFKERRASHQAKISAGQTLVFAALPQATPSSTSGEANVPERQTAIFVKPIVVNAKGESVAGPGSPSTSPAKGSGGQQGGLAGGQLGTGDDRLVLPGANMPAAINQSPTAPSTTSGPPAGLSSANGSLPTSLGLPVLGNVPILGRLFESNGKGVGMAGSTSDGFVAAAALADPTKVESTGPPLLSPGNYPTPVEPPGGAARAENTDAAKTAEPRLSINADKMIWDEGGGVATGNVEIDTGSVVIRTERAKIQPKGDAKAHPLDNVVVPKFEVTEVTLGEAVNRLLDAARAQGVEPGNVVVPKLPVEPRITMSLAGIPFFEALKYVTSLSNTKFTRAANGIVITELKQPVQNPSTSAGAGRGVLPSAGLEATSKSTRKRAVMISMVKGGDIRIDDNPVKSGQLPEAIAELKRQDPVLPVYIRAAGDVPYRDVQAVMNVLESAGVTDVSFRSSP
jgi:hypothetical protein